MKSKDEILKDKRVKSVPSIFTDTYIVKLKQADFRVMAGVDGDYEHVSVTVKGKKRIPTWYELCTIKDIFFYEDEECIQYFPKKAEYINVHEYCMHIWRERE